MGDAEFDIKPFLEAIKMRLGGLPSGTIITRVHPSRENCLAEESCITWTDNKVIQNMILRLCNVERGEVELQLQWIDVPGSRGLWAPYLSSGDENTRYWSVHVFLAIGVLACCRGMFLGVINWHLVNGFSISYFVHFLVNRMMIFQQVIVVFWSYFHLWVAVKTWWTVYDF